MFNPPVRAHGMKTVLCVCGFKGSNWKVDFVWGTWYGDAQIPIMHVECFLRKR
jgi:hypothetical protein